MNKKIVGVLAALGCAAGCSGPADAPPLAEVAFGPASAGEYRYAGAYGEEFDDGDQFGAALALTGDGNRLIVTATAEDSAATGTNGDQTDNSKRSAGAAYVFDRVGDTWAQSAYIKPSNPEVDALFGYSAAIAADGSRIAVGAYDATARDEDGLTSGINNIPGPDYQDSTRPTTGAVYAFVESDDGPWTQQAYIKASNTGSADIFGSRLAVSGDGNVLVVGAQFEDSGATGVGGDQSDNSVPDSGAVYLFRRWKQCLI